MTLSRIREINGTAVLTLPKRILDKCDFEIGNDVRLLIASDNRCIIITRDLNAN